MYKEIPNELKPLLYISHISIIPAKTQHFMRDKVPDTLENTEEIGSFLLLLNLQIK